MIYTATARAADLAANGEENNPFVAFENAGASAILSGATTLTDGAAANAFTGTTYDYWLPVVPVSGACGIIMQLPTARNCSFAAIAAHNLADLGGSVRLYNSPDGVTYTQITNVITPSDNAPIAFRLPASGNERQYWSIWFSGLTENDPLHVGVAFLGDELVMQRRFYQGYAPVLQPTEITMQSNVSEGGNYVGSSVVRRGSTLQAQFNHLSPSFVRGDDFQAFQTAFNTGQPFFFGWRPQKYPEDLHYCWRTGNAIRPENTGPKDFMGCQFSARAYDE